MHASLSYAKTLAGWLGFNRLRCCGLHAQYRAKRPILTFPTMLLPVALSEAQARAQGGQPVAPLPSTSQDIVRGLLCSPARISSKYFYDARGCELFEAITRLPEYYPTRTEIGVLRRCSADIARSVGACRSLIELGAGNCEKVRLLLAALQPGCFVGVDIAGDFVQAAVARLARDFPGLQTVAVEADITAPVTLPPCVDQRGRLVFYPGSSIGNFPARKATALLRQMHALAGQNGGLLIGIDLPKDRPVLEAAYNDAVGVTAEFNRNVLRHVNRCIGSDFVAAQWEHVAFYNAACWRIEMHLQARQALRVQWPGGKRDFARGERIHTESSYKYPLLLFTRMLSQAGFTASQVWTDEREWFAVIHAQA